MAAVVGAFCFLSDFNRAACIRAFLPGEHMEEVFAALPAPIIFCIRIVNGMGPPGSFFSFVLSLVLVLFRKADKGLFLRGANAVVFLYCWRFICRSWGAASSCILPIPSVSDCICFCSFWDIMCFHDRVQRSLQSTVFCCLRRGLCSRCSRRLVSWGSLIRLWLITGW